MCGNAAITMALYFLQCGSTIQILEDFQISSVEFGTSSSRVLKESKHKKTLDINETLQQLTMNTDQQKTKLKEQYTNGYITFDEYTERLVHLLVSYVMILYHDVNSC